eukprot:1158512-Pelagomonas_calceolata.AAC.4
MAQQLWHRNMAHAWHDNSGTAIWHKHGTTTVARHGTRMAQQLWHSNMAHAWHSNIAQAWHKNCGTTQHDCGTTTAPKHGIPKHGTTTRTGLTTLLPSFSTPPATLLAPSTQSWPKCSPSGPTLGALVLASDLRQFPPHGSQQTELVLPA